jgi:hypothetical protein
MPFKAEIYNIESFLSSVSRGEHGCLFYVDKQQKLNLLLDFPRNGFEKDEFCVYATATDDKAEIENKVREERPLKFQIQSP